MPGLQLPSVNVPQLLSLLTGGFTPANITRIVGQVLSGDSVTAAVRDQVVSRFRQLVDAEEGRATARVFATTILKQVENAANPSTGLPAEARIALAGLLAQNGAALYAHAGECLLQLHAAQATLERARGTAGETAARLARESAEAAFLRANVDITRAVAGGDARSLTP